MQDVKFQQVQFDEIWSFTYAKQMCLKSLTPAMAAGVADKLSAMEEIVALIDAIVPKPGPHGPYKKMNSN